MVLGSKNYSKSATFFTLSESSTQERARTSDHILHHSAVIV